MSRIALKNCGVFLCSACLLVLLAMPVLAEQFVAAQLPGPMPCRNKVVIYLDLSGSMRNTANPRLRDNCQKFICDSLLDPQKGVVARGDQVVLRGFISQVDYLAESIESFHPLKHMDALRRQMGQKLNDLDSFKAPLVNKAAKSKGGKGKLTKGNEHNGKPPKEKNSDFAVVVNDMMRIFGNTRLSPQDGFNQLIFILLTDGNHEREATTQDFLAGIGELGQRTEQYRQTGRVKTIFFGLPPSSTARKHHKVTKDFQVHLDAADLYLDPNNEQEGSLANVANLIADRLQIKAVTETIYDPRSHRLYVELHTHNPSCRQVRLTKLQATLYRGLSSPEHKDPTWQELKIWEVTAPHDIPMGGGPVSWSKDELYLEPGRYKLDLIPFSQGPAEGKVVQGLSAGAEVSRVFSASPPPGHAWLWILLILTALATAMVILAFWKMKGREEQENE